MDRPNYITPTGYATLRAEYEQLFATERPALVETIAWAAGNGDRSENGDYIYGRKRLREIDRRLGWLSKRMKAAKVVDPAKQEDRTRAWFGATVTVVDEDDRERDDRDVDESADVDDEPTDRPAAITVVHYEPGEEPPTDDAPGAGRGDQADAGGAEDVRRS